MVLTTGALAEHTSSDLAQGGIAAAVGFGDTPLLHALDTMHAGAGLCEPEVVEAVTAAAPEAIGYLEHLGVEFDRTATGERQLGLEGAHGRHRIVHSGGDATGHAVMRAVVRAVRRTPTITVIENARALRLVTRGGAVHGVVIDVAGSAEVIETARVVLATGGIGGLFAHTTNPPGSRGQGLALAARAGAVLRDLEMVQFHPTALDVGIDPMPLVSEAVRGAGAVLRDEETGARLLADDLAARDVVSRAVAAHGGRVLLDTTEALGPHVDARFPTVAASCRAAGIDPATTPIPVRPAAHYHMGGVQVDRHGRTTVPGLWAVGEVASTGLHGANRLASNSLLEAVVCGGWVAEDLLGPGGTAPETTSIGSDLPAMPLSHPSPTPPHELAALRELMSSHLGVTRTTGGLEDLRRLTARRIARAGADVIDDATLVAFLLTISALRRTESLGAHQRLDGPARHDEHRSAGEVPHLTVTLDAALRDVVPESGGVRS